MSWTVCVFCMNVSRRWTRKNSLAKTPTSIGLRLRHDGRLGVQPEDMAYKKAYTLEFVDEKDGCALTSRVMPIVSLRGISKRFASGVAALNPIDLDIGRGEFLSLIGPSGCGKTSLLRIIAGLSEPSGGERHMTLNPDKCKRAAPWAHRLRLSGPDLDAVEHGHR